MASELLDCLPKQLTERVPYPTVRAILCQKHPHFALRQTMDTGGIFIANLAKGAIGEEQSALLGAFLISFVNSTAMARVDMPVEARRPFSLIVDEAQSFPTRALEHLLSESRKYGCRLTISNQSLDQLDTSLQSAIFTNAASLICFTTSDGFGVTADVRWTHSSVDRRCSRDVWKLCTATVGAPAADSGTLISRFD